MSRIINIGDFYRAQTSFPSVIGSLEIPGGEIFVYTSYAQGEILNSPAQSGTTGPIELTTISLPPSVGQYTRFTVGGLTDAYIVTATGTSSTGDYFTISTPLPGNTTSNVCGIYLNTSPISITRNIRIVMASSGDTTFFTDNQPISPASYLYMYNNEDNAGPFLIQSATYTSTGTTLNIHSSNTLTQNYDGYNAFIQRRTTSTGSGDPISTANAHAKRQFGNHPRIQQ